MRITPTLLTLTFLLLAAGPAHADAEAGEADKEAKPDELRYVLGAAVRWQPEYAGSLDKETKLSPLWALRWGRWRISTSGGTALLGFGGQVLGAGASTDLLRRDNFRLGLSLRVDSGRKSARASTTEGLPDVRKTVRGRLFAGYELSKDWQLSGSLSQDLLGRKGGLIGGVDLGWRLRHSSRSELTAGAGISFADGVNTRSYFGVTPEGSASSGLPVYQPGSGLRDVHAGLGWTYGLTQHWIVFSSAGASLLQGPAADSPLTQRRFSTQAAIGLAYRN